MIVQTHPGAYSYHEDWLRPCLHVTGERQQLVEADQARSVERGTVAVVPYVGVEDLAMAAPVAGSPRPALLFYSGACSFAHDHFGPDWRLHFSSGKILREFVTEGLRALGKGAEVNVRCAGANQAGAPTHVESMGGMRRAVFCPIIAGDTQVCAAGGGGGGPGAAGPGWSPRLLHLFSLSNAQRGRPARCVQSSRRLTEAILNGCLPVFFGRPYHNLPLAEDIDYRSFSVGQGRGREGAPS